MKELCYIFIYFVTNRVSNIIVSPTNCETEKMFAHLASTIFFLRCCLYIYTWNNKLLDIHKDMHIPWLNTAQWHCFLHSLENVHILDLALKMLHGMIPLRFMMFKTLHLYMINKAKLKLSRSKKGEFAQLVLIYYFSRFIHFLKMAGHYLKWQKFF